jgi:hypothetical protein
LLLVPVKKLLLVLYKHYFCLNLKFEFVRKTLFCLLHDRYEYQKDHSLLCEDKFTYDSEWLKNQIGSCLEFWLGEREAAYVHVEERWKCRFCQYATVCPAYTDSKGMNTDTTNDSKAKEV